jgi:hypothetical protein
LGGRAEESSLDDDWNLWESSSAEDLVESGLGNIDNRGFRLVLGEFGLCGLGEECPELINVDGRAVLSVEVSSEDSDTLLSEMARMAALDPTYYLKKFDLA